MWNLRVFERFMKEEHGQALFEYILFTGGIIVGTVVIFVFFASMGSSAAEDLHSNSDNIADAMTAETDEIISSIY